MGLILVAVAALLIVLGLIFLGIPIAACLLAVGAIGLWVLESANYAETQLVLNLWEQGTNFALTAIPLYLLMGQLVYRTGLARDLYACVYRWVGRLPGGLAIASVIASAGFGSVSGGSATAVATLGPMCMPEMRKFGYSGALAAGSIASAGTLGILIPPSIFLIAYGIWTETSIGWLFVAGIVPGLIMTLAYSVAIIVVCVVKPQFGPVGDRFTWGEKFRSLIQLLPVIAIFLLITGGIYGGVFDPTEAGAIGVVGVIAIALVMRRMNWQILRDCLKGTTSTSLMIFLVVLGGHVISRFLVLTNITSALVGLITSFELSPYELIAALTIMYLLLGMLLDVWAMLLLTIPFVFPVITAAGIDPVWFGIYIIVMCELAAITPPVGLNVYIMARVAPDVPLGSIFLGVLPFFFTTLLIIAFLTIFPSVVTWLPAQAFG